MQNQLDPLHVPSGDGKDVVAAQMQNFPDEAMSQTHSTRNDLDTFWRGLFNAMQYILLKVGSATAPWSSTVSPVEGEDTRFPEPLNNFGEQGMR